MNIAFCTTCKGRTQHVRQTLPRNLRDNSRSSNKFILLNYGSQDGLLEYVASSHMKDVESGRLVLYSFYSNSRFHVAHAKNMAARLGELEGGRYLVTLDADNFTGPDFDHVVMDGLGGHGIFLCPDHYNIRHSGLPAGHANRPHRGYAGRLAIRTQDFMKAGAYNEAYDTWRGEDIDLIFRLRRMGLTEKNIAPRYLETIPHDASVRFREYPHAQKYENDSEWKEANERNDTVVNYGRFGMGTVYKNFDPAPIELNATPTRIFGIGLHKTATTSFHRACQILGYDSFHWGVGEAPLIWDEMNEAGRSRVLEKYFALCDLPIPLLYKQLDQAYPGSKFVLTIRNEGDWLRSVEQLWDRRYNPNRWEWDVYPFSNRIHAALYGQRHFDRQVMLETYRRHNAEVQEYFKHRSSDLLVLSMDGEQTWPGLCGFLGKALPSVPYPRENPTREAVHAIFT